MSADRRIAVVLGVRLVRVEDAARRTLTFAPADAGEMRALDADGLEAFFAIVAKLVSTARSSPNYAGWRIQGRRPGVE